MAFNSIQKSPNHFQFLSHFTLCTFCPDKVVNSQKVKNIPLLQNSKSETSYRHFKQWALPSYGPANNPRYVRILLFSYSPFSGFSFFLHEVFSSLCTPIVKLYLSASIRPSEEDLHSWKKEEFWCASALFPLFFFFCGEKVKLHFRVLRFTRLLHVVVWTSE